MKNLNKVILVICSLFMFSMLVGCAQPGNPERMALSYNEIQSIQAISTTKSKNIPFKNNLAIESVQGGKKTNPLWSSQVDAKSFQIALADSLTKASLYSQDADKARYHLKANLLRLDQPLIGLNFKVTSHINYQLLDTKNNKIVFEKTLITPYEAKFTQALYGVERLKKANEGAIKENIKALMNSLYDI